MDLVGRCVAVTLSATADVIQAMVVAGGQKEYRCRRTDGADNPMVAFYRWLLKQRNAGQREAEGRLYEVDLVAFLGDLYGGESARSDAEIRAAESRYEADANAIHFEIQRRLAGGERETPQMCDLEIRLLALDVAHGIELIRARQRRKRALEREQLRARTGPALVRAKASAQADVARDGAS